ncbi:MAG: hypothetical protein KIT73_09680 [Burkholderiales bacterium]|nr:hypothetical protein [Burkholderiales bacterium]
MPMRALFWLLGLFAVAVGLVLAARYNSGYVLVVLTDRRIELSLNFAALLVLFTLVVGYLALRAVSLAAALPAKVRQFRAERRMISGRDAFHKALRSYFEARYGQAEKAAARALAAGESPGLSAMIAARAAHEMRAFEARDQYLASVEGGSPEEDYLRSITQAELLLDERRYHDGLAVLSHLDHGNTAVLRLELKAQQMAKNWDRVEALLPQLERKRVLDPVVLAQIRRTAVSENLKRRALEPRQLREAWDRIPADLRVDPLVARTAALCHMALGDNAEAHRVIEQALEMHWDAELVALYAEGFGRDTRQQIEKAEGWLPLRSRDAGLLLTLGRLCAHEGLWGKAKNYFEASLAVEPSHTAHLELAKLAERNGPEGASEQHYRAALDLSLEQLREVTGGRRRLAL